MKKGRTGGDRSTGAKGPAGTAGRLADHLLVLRIVMALALVRFLAVPFAEDAFDNGSVPLPTWDWCLFALTPPLFLWLHRTPEKWRLVGADSVHVKLAAAICLVYAVAMLCFQHEWVLAVAAVFSASTFLGIWWLNRREDRDAR